MFDEKDEEIKELKRLLKELEERNERQHYAISEALGPEFQGDSELANNVSDLREAYYKSQSIIAEYCKDKRLLSEDAKATLRDQEELIAVRKELSSIGVQEGHCPGLVKSLKGQIEDMKRLVVESRPKCWECDKPATVKSGNFWLCDSKDGYHMFYTRTKDDKRLYDGFDLLTLRI